MVDLLTDLAPDLLRHGYRTLPRRWLHRRDEDALWARLLGRRTLVVRGPAGAELFYDEQVVRRTGAVPLPLSWVLFGPGAVHGLDDDEHRRRKAVFAPVRDRAAVTALGDAVEEGLREAVGSWSTRAPVDVFDELARTYGRAALAFAGLRYDAAASDRLVRLFVAMVDGFGFAPAAYARGVAARAAAQRWAARTVARHREAVAVPDEGTVLHALVAGVGRDLPLREAGTELLNVVRPTTAVAWLGVSAARELLRHPELGPGLVGDGRDAATARSRFAQEVRRTTLFVPVLTGLVRAEHHWQGRRLRVGDRLLLDVPGTDGHRVWGDPWRFRPDRFQTDPGPFALVPQGGGDVDDGHRCPGEPVTLELLDRTLRVLASASWSAHGTEADPTRMPTRPRMVVDGSQVG